MSKRPTVEHPDTYNPSNLLDTLLNTLALTSDTALARLLEISPALMPKIRTHKHPVGASLLIRMHEITGMSIRSLRDLMGDRRIKYRLSDAAGAAMRKPKPDPNGHVLYTTADKDRPESICDRNGEVVLGLCKVCDRTESELTEKCEPKPQETRWRVGEFWSSAYPGSKVLTLATGPAEIAAYGRHKDFIRWVGGSYIEPLDIEGKPVDPTGPHPDKSDTELGFAYRMMLKSHRAGCNVNFVTGDVSIKTPKEKANG